MQRLVFDKLSGRARDHHIAVTRLCPGQITDAHTHDFAEFFLVEEGTGTHHWNGRELPLRRGSFAFVRASDAHWYRADAPAGLCFINLALAPEWWASFSRLCAEEWRHLCGAPSGHVQLVPADAARCAALLHELLAAGAGDGVLLVEAVAGLFRGLRERTVQNVTIPRDAPAWLVAIMRDFADVEMLAKPIAFWQKRAGVSPEHFARTCKRCVGESPTVLLNRARVEYVKVRLSQGEGKITTLAFDAGFQNLGFFYRCFRRFAGCTPTEWAMQRGSSATVPR